MLHRNILHMFNCDTENRIHQITLIYEFSVSDAHFSIFLIYKKNLESKWRSLRVVKQFSTAALMHLYIHKYSYHPNTLF